MDNNKQQDAEIRKMILQLNDKARGIIEATGSESYLGMCVEQRVKTLQELKEVTETLLKETIDALTRESYEKHRHMISFCFTSMTNIAERLDSAIRTIKLKANSAF